MTSDRTPTPAEQRLVEFADLIFRGKHASRTGIDPEQAELIVRLKQGDRVPPFDATVFQPRKEHLMSLVTTAPAGAMPGSGTVAAPPNGKLPYPMPSYPRARSWRPTLMQLVSAAVLLALIGGLIFGIAQNRNDANPTIPAVIQGSPSPEASPLGSDWGQFRGGVERTGYSSDPGPGANLNLLWTFTSAESLNAIVEAGGNVIGFGADGGLYTIDALTGQQVWAVDLSQGTTGDPGTAKLPAMSDGVIYVSTLEGDLVAVDATGGEVLWQQHLADNTPNSPIVANGTVYVVAGGNRFLGFDAETGEQTWEAALPGMVDNQFPTIADGRIYIADDTSQVHAFDLESGELVWSSDDIGAHRVSAFVDGVLYVPGYDGRLTAISAEDGHTLWQTEASGMEGLNPIATPSVIVATVSGTGVQGLDPKTGKVLWTSDLVVSGTYSPHAAGDYVYFLRDDDSYVALRLLDGTEAATVDQVVGAGSTAAISGSLLFVSGIDGHVRAFGPGAGEAIDTLATPAAVADGLPATESSTGQQNPVEAPKAGEIQAQLISTFTRGGDFPGLLFLSDDSDGHLWANNVDDGSLNEYDRDLNLLATWPFGLGSGPGQFDWAPVEHPEYPDISWMAAGMTWGPDGTAYVTDLQNARIQIIGTDGKVAGSWGTRGNSDGQFQDPVDIARNGDEIAVVDLGRRDIQWFDLQGNFLRNLTGPQPGAQFLRPTDIAFDSQGNFWVVDTSAQQLLKFDKAGSLLFIVGNGPPSTSAGRFHNPAGIFADDRDRLWIADQWNKRIQIFDPNGNLLAVWDGCDTDVGCFNNTDIVFADGNGNVFVADWDAAGIDPARLMKFHITSMPEVPMMAAATPAAAGLATPVASPVAG